MPTNKFPSELATNTETSAFATDSKNPTPNAQTLEPIQQPTPTTPKPTKTPRKKVVALEDSPKASSTTRKTTVKTSTAKKPTKATLENDEPAIATTLAPMILESIENTIIPNTHPTPQVTTKDDKPSHINKVANKIVKTLQHSQITAMGKTSAQLRKDATQKLKLLSDLENLDTDNEQSQKPQLPLKELVKQYDSVSLLLQGGGALGAYQAGIYEGLHKQGIKIDRISGISIGALNTAIIAGNLPQNRLAALQGFWQTITQRNYTPAGFNVYRQAANSLDQLSKIDAVSHFMPWIFENGFLKQQLRAMESSSEAFQTMMEGQRGFFKPRYFMPFDTTPNHLSYYTTDKLRETLAKYCNLELVNDVKRMKVSVSAVNVRTGNFAIFSNENEELNYDHFIASGALPPGFPAVEIDGEFYWDGGMVSNTPLNEILSHEEHLSQLIFQVDLWDARGLVPENMLEIDERVKDIQYSSKTRMVTDFMAQKLRYTRLIKDLLQIIDNNTDPDNIDKEWIEKARDITEVGVKNVIHLIYHKKSYERGYKDYEFSATSMQDHWNSGLEDIENTFRHPDWFGLPEDDEIFVTHDIHQKRKKLSQMNRA